MNPSLDVLFFHTPLDELDNILVKMIDQVCEVSLMRIRAEAFSSNPVHIVFPGKNTDITIFVAYKKKPTLCNHQPAQTKTRLVVSSVVI